MNIKKLKEVNVNGLADFIDQEIFDYCNNKRGELTVEKMSLVKNDLARIATAYSAYLIKEKGFSDSYEEFIENEKITEVVKEIFNDSVKDIWNIVVKVKEGFSSKELLAYTMWYDFKDWKKTGMSSTPESIIKLSSRLLEIQDGDTVINLCSEKGDFIRDNVGEGSEADYTGVEINYIAKGISEIRMAAMDYEANIHISDVMDFEGEAKFDKVFSDYPFNARRLNCEDAVKRYAVMTGIDEELLKNVSSDWLFNLAIVDNMKTTGKGAGICIGGDLWNTKAVDQEIRKYFVENGLIESIIALPSGMYEYTGIPTYIVVFSTDNRQITMVDASNKGLAEKHRIKSFSELEIEEILDALKMETSISKTVSKDQVKAKEYMLDPMKYLDAVPDFQDGVKLEDLAISITRGDQFKASELKKVKTEERTEYRCLELADMRDGYIEFEDEYLKELPSGREKYLAKNRMIVLTRLANPEVKSALIEMPENEKILVTGHFIMIEIDESKVNPEYVQSFLASETGKKCLNNISTGNVIRNLSLGQLKNMVIPVPDRNTQDRIGAEYMATLDEMLMLKSKLTRKEEALKHIYEEGYFA